MQPEHRHRQRARTFRDLRVWQEAPRLAVEARPLCALLVQLGRAHLADQLQRAASSVHVNIAEGWGRATAPDRKRFYTTAWGSLREAEALLIEIGLERGAPDALVRACVQRVHNVTRLLSAFRRGSHG